MTESKFLSAFQDFESDKIEARHLQSEIAVLTADCNPLEEAIARDIATAELALEKAREDGETKKRELRDAIKNAERDYERMRKRVSQKSDGLVELLHAEIRNQ